MDLVGHRKSLSAVFLPKVSAEISAETLSVFQGLSVFRQKDALSAERRSFGSVALGHFDICINFSDLVSLG